MVGWDNVNYVTAEMKNPSRDLSRVIHTAQPLVICIISTERQLISKYRMSWQTWVIMLFCRLT